jgi:hypothetical protein
LICIRHLGCGSQSPCSGLRQSGGPIQSKISQRYR